MKANQEPATDGGGRRRPGWRATCALLALASVTGLAAVTAAPASAASASGKLSVRPGHDAYSTELTVIGSFPMSQQRARDVLAQNPSIAVSYIGDDPAWDDLLVVRYNRANAGEPTYLSLTDQGLSLYSRHDFDTSWLNEDPEGRDEVYAEVTLSAAGRTVARFNTFPIHGYF